MEFSAVAVAGMIGAAAVHVYWAFGGVWPGSDRSDLARKVVGDTDEFPSTAMTLGVVGLLLLGALIVGAANGLWSLPVSERLVTVGAWSVGGVLVLRGIAGFVLSGYRQVQGRGTPFSVRDVLVYSPLTLLLGWLSTAGLIFTT